MKSLLHKAWSVLGVFMITFSMAIPVNAITSDELRIINLDAPLYYGGDVSVRCEPASNLDTFLQALAQKESGGDPEAANPNSSARGKYQYLTGTWEAMAELYGPAGQYATADQAPEEVQDAVAYLNHLRNYQIYEGDIMTLAIAHFGGNDVADNPDQWDDPAPGSNTGTFRDYGEDILDIIDSGEADDIPLYYEDAPDFDRWVAEAGGEAENNGCPAGGIPAGSFVHYRQCDDEWRDHPFGTTNMCSGGCGPTSVAMVLATMYDESITPVDVADWGSDNNGHIDGSGSNWSVMIDQAPEVLSNDELEVEDYGNNLDDAIEALENGGLVIATGRNTGPPYTDGGHIIVVREILSNGNFLIGDPALTGGHSFEHEWTFNDINRGRNFWGVTETE